MRPAHFLSHIPYTLVPIVSKAFPTYPCLFLLHQVNCIAHDMNSTVDYRRLAQHQRGLYFITPPAGATAKTSGTSSASTTSSSGAGSDPLMERFLELAPDVPPAPTRVDVMMGRTLEVPLAAGVWVSVRVNGGVSVGAGQWLGQWETMA